jgi:hypothetical protein
MSQKLSVKLLIRILKALISELWHLVKSLYLIFNSRRPKNKYPDFTETIAMNATE